MCGAQKLALLDLILYREWTTEEEMNTEDRRAPGATRMPFDALVEVGGALGPSFEAQAVNVSEDGMQLKTAYLPEQGQPLTCRFDSGPGQSVLASGEVVWSLPVERGGEFGIRFTDMDAESVDSLKRICGLPVVGDKEPPRPSSPVHSGSKVRLHIDGLASPMRARIRDAREADVTVGSDLGFLQVGRQLELEDAQSGNKRPANIDHVEVAVDPASHIPQLVVTLRYADAPATAGGARPSAHAAGSMPDDLGAVEEASVKMKGALAESFSRVGPAVERFAGRAKTMIALLAKRRLEERSPLRRTTAPPPGGGLHARGRGVVRGEARSLPGDESPNGPNSGMTTKRKAVLAGAVMFVAIAIALAMKKSHHDGEGASGTPSGATAAEVAPPASAAAATPAPPPPATPGPFTSPAFGSATADLSDSTGKTAHKKHARVAPFGNGPVHHGNVLRLKMDDPIESIEGAQQPTGFTVKIPGRKAIEAAAPLAARDSRIAAIKVANEGAGAELSVTFKDGVPNYQVSARGDTLVIALAPAGSLEETMAKKDAQGGKAAKHGKHGKHAKHGAENTEQEL
jgi:hypothetical protein